MNKLYYWLVLQLVLSSPTLFAQTSITGSSTIAKILCASSSEQNERGSFSVSIGLMHNTLFVTDRDGTMADSTLQDSTITSKAMTDEVFYRALRGDKIDVQRTSGNPNEIAATISVYPNPFKDHVTLFLDESKIERGSELRYTLFDITGNAIHTGQLGHRKKEIALGSFPNGVYFMVLFQNDQEIKSFKLLKNDL